MFSDGETIIADEQHEWLTFNRRARKSLGRRTGGPNVRNLPQCKTKHAPRVVTTAEIAATLYDGREVNHAVPVALPLQCRDADLPIPPYTLGAWLGDGTRIAANITTADCEVIEQVCADGLEVAAVPSQKKGAAQKYSVSTPGVKRVRDVRTGRMVSDQRNFLVKLRLLGLTQGKHIPAAYLRASIQQRRDLLAGLMDTDGYIDAKGRCEFTNTSARLADDVRELCLSLGMKATLTEGVATLNGRIIGPKYRVHFTPYSPVFRLTRKLDRHKAKGAQGDRQQRRYIVAVRPANSVPVRCIQVDSPSNLYLAGRAMIPTHNSFVGSYDLIRRAKPGRLYMAVAPTYKVLSDASLRSFVDNARKLRYLKKANTTSMHFRLGNGAEVLFRSADNPETLRGPNLSGVWIDEASVVDKPAFDILIGCLREGGEMGWLSATFTPKGKLHWTYGVFGPQTDGKLRPNTELFHARTDQNPFNPPEFAAQLRSQYTSAMAEQEVGGEFTDAEGTLFKREWFNGKIVEASPVEATRVRFWDKAATEEGGCFTCGILMSRTRDGRKFVEHEVRGQWSPRRRDEIMLATSAQDRQLYGDHQPYIWIEKEGGSAGVDSAVAAANLLDGYPLAFHIPSGSKEVRAQPLASQCEAGNVYLVADKNRPWDVNGYIDEVCFFPKGYQDRVDASSGAHSRLQPSPGAHHHGDLLLHPTNMDYEKRLEQDYQVVTVNGVKIRLDEPEDDWVNYGRR